MLKFEEADRPSFVELSKLVLTSIENTIDSPKPGPAGRATGASNKSLAGGPQTASHSKNLGIGDKKVSKTFSMQNFKDNIEGGGAGGLGAQVNQPSNADGSQDGVQRQGIVGRKVVDSTKSDNVSQMHEDSQ